MTLTIREVYEKYKHMDKTVDAPTIFGLADAQHGDGNDLRDSMLYECGQAIKNAVEKEAKRSAL